MSKNRAAASLGKKGGRAKSSAKTAAAQANGAKGGRPKKTAPVALLPNVKVRDGADGSRTKL
jgi:hypothetical protein